MKLDPDSAATLRSLTRLRPRHFWSGSSRNALQVRRHDAILSQQTREAEDLSVADSLSFACKAQRFDGDIQSQLVSIFETVNQCSRDTIDANGSVIDAVHFDSLIERPDIETVDLHRRRM